MDSVATPVDQALSILPPSLADWAVPVVSLAVSLGTSPSGLDRDTLVLSINDVLSRSGFALAAALENGFITTPIPHSTWLRLTYCRHLLTDETPYI